MENFFDDFDNDFENDEDSFEDNLEEDLEMDEPFSGETEPDDEPEETELQEDDLDVNPFFIGGAFGFGYEEGLRERKRIKRKRTSDDSD